MGDELREALDAVLRDAENKEALRAYMQAIKQACSECLERVFMQMAHAIAYYATPDLGESEQEGYAFLALCHDGSNLLAAND